MSYIVCSLKKPMKKLIYKLIPIYQTIYHAIFSIKQDIYMYSLKLKLRSLGKFTQIYRAHIVEPYNVTIGHHVYINKGCDMITTESEIKIGNYVMIGPNVTLIAQNHKSSNWKKPMILENSYEKTGITIEDDVWIGANATILSGTTIKRGAIVAAGAVVTKNVEPYSVSGGVPAKHIKYRFDENTRNKAAKINLENFNKHKISWKKWGVGKVV